MIFLAWTIPQATLITTSDIIQDIYANQQINNTDEEQLRPTASKLLPSVQTMEKVTNKNAEHIIISEKEVARHGKNNLVCHDVNRDNGIKIGKTRNIVNIYRNYRVVVDYEV